MRRLVQVFIACAALLAVGCDQQPISPEGPAFKRDLPPVETLSGLTVSISGDSWVSSAGNATYTASVTGGNGNYTYAWYGQSCNEYPVDEEWCESSPVQMYSTTSSASRYRGIYDLRIHVTVYVSEIGGTKTGFAEFWQYGPNELSCNPWC